MAVLLLIETATNVCSTALSVNGQIIDSHETADEKAHSTLLTVFIDEMLKKHKLKLDAVAVSQGPGSYTGLRIGVSVAKGIAYGSNFPLIAINTLQAMAYGILSKVDVSQYDLFCPMIDARRMEVYSAFYTTTNETFRDVQADIIDENSYQAILKEKRVLFFGNGSDKCKDVLGSENANFLKDIVPSAKDLAQLAETDYQNKKFVDVAYFEPFYLKDFVATTAKAPLF